MDWYRVFYMAGKTGSISKAADELFITQPAVSHSIKQLEAKLGGPLFVRTPKGVKLTTEGEVLFKHIEQAFRYVHTGEKKIAEMRSLASGEVRIGAGDTLCKHYLLPYLSTFHQSYPDIRIQVVNRTTPQTIRLLREGKIDFGIVNLPVEETNLNVRQSTELQDCFVVSPGYRKRPDRQALELAELTAYPLILLEQGSSTRRYTDRHFESNGVSLRPEIELGSIDLLVEFAKSGLGIACVIRNFVQSELERGELIEIKLKKPIPPRGIGLVTLRNEPLSAAARQFMEMLP